jgi:hypothetical protein
MRKIPTVLRRNPDDMKHVLPEVNPGCEWVLAGDGVPTRKYDGTCVMLDAAGWWARRELKPGKPAPEGFVAVEHDENTGKTVGWVPMEKSPFARWHAEAVENFSARFGDRRGSGAFGTYELVGPKIQGDPDRFGEHWLVPHEGAMILRSIVDLDTPAALMSFARWAGDEGYEGIVWHHPDGRMAKLKARDIPPSSEGAAP